MTSSGMQGEGHSNESRGRAADEKGIRVDSRERTTAYRVYYANSTCIVKETTVQQSIFFQRDGT